MHFFVVVLQLWHERIELLHMGLLAPLEYFLGFQFGKKVGNYCSKVMRFNIIDMVLIGELWDMTKTIVYVCRC